MKIDRLISYNHDAGIHIRAKEDGTDSRIIEGYAIVFGRESQPLWEDNQGKVVEVISPDAVSEDLLKKSDIKLTMYHDMSRILGRSKKGEGTLSWSIDERGVKFECEMPETSYGDEALALVRRGDIDGCSFMFATFYGNPQYVERTDSDGKTVFTVRKITRIFDFTLTPDPAYPQTECNARSRRYDALETEETPDELETEEDNNTKNKREMDKKDIENQQTQENAQSRAQGVDMSRIEGMVDTKIQRAMAASRSNNADTLAVADDVLRRARDERFDVTVRLQRAIMNTDGLADTGIIPVAEQEFLKPLRAGLIWDKVGLNVQSGLVGKLRWPKHTKATASWEDETSKLIDSSINFSKLTMQGARLGVAIPVSKVELNDSQGIVERVVREEMPAACSDLINSSMLTLYAEYKEGSDILTKTVAGPWAQSPNDTSRNCAKVDLAANITRKNLLDMRATVVSSGIHLSNPVWAMNDNTKAILEDTKVDAGSGRFVCEEDKIFGAPVFTSNEIPDGVVLFGDFSYQAAGFFGPIDMTIDPYTLARQHSTDFVLNMRFGTATLRKEAFVIGMTPSAKTAFNTALSALVISE